MITVREATTADAHKLVVMSVRLLKASPYRTILRATTVKHINQHIAATRKHGVIFVADDSLHGVVGVLGMMIVRHPFTGQDYADQVAWWVEPEHRATMAGPRLIHEMEGWARKKALYMVSMPSPVGSQLNRLYRARGYQAVEFTWIKVLE